MSSEFLLTLVRSNDDPPKFSAEYQAELRQFSSQAKPSSQRASTRDSVGEVGGLIGEFIFNNANALIAALSYLGTEWLKVRFGRKLSLKFDGIEIVANNPEDIEEMLKQVRRFRENQSEQD
jgi:hypothetical protein